MSKSSRSKRRYTQAPVAVDPGVGCPHCGNRYEHTILNVYPNGNRRRRCGKCAMPFVTMRVREPMIAVIVQRQAVNGGAGGAAQKNC